MTEPREPTREEIVEIIRSRYVLGSSWPAECADAIAALYRPVVEERDAAKQDALRLFRALAAQGNDTEQTLGKVLGYPWFKDDQKNFPDATEEHGVCVGEHVPETIAAEAANRITALRADLAQKDEEIAALRGALQGVSDLIDDKDLVRNIANDGDPLAYVRQAMKIVKALQVMQAALRAERPAAETSS